MTKNGQNWHAHLKNVILNHLDKRLRSLYDLSISIAQQCINSVLLTRFSLFYQYFFYTRSENTEWIFLKFLNTDGKFSFTLHIKFSNLN